MYGMYGTLTMRDFTYLDGESSLPMTKLGEDAWIEVIHKMDEVYNELVTHELALEQKNASLEDAQQFVLSVLAAMSDILIVCDRDGCIEVVNQALMQFSGKSEAELIGTSLFDLFADMNARESFKHKTEVLGQQNLSDCESLMCGANGDVTQVSLNCTPHYDHLGRQVGMVITGRPVGELRNAYKALHEAHADLKRTQQQLIHSEKMASLGRLVAGVAHELNNPISFVLGNTYALKRYMQRIETYIAAVHNHQSVCMLDNLRQELHIDRMLEDLPSLIDGTVEGAERSRQIVDGLKRFSAMGQDEMRRLNIAEIIELAISWVIKGSADNLQVHSQLPENIMVIGVLGQLQQVVINLIQNAYDATADKPEPMLEISAQFHANNVEISFKDNGTGIAAEHLSHVFEPFFTTKPVGKGTGLGLAISYGIVERHGGKLKVVNRADGGAQFIMTLPLADKI